jgi:hypothetical protein
MPRVPDAVQRLFDDAPQSRDPAVAELFAEDDAVRLAALTRLAPIFRELRPSKNNGGAP